MKKNSVTNKYKSISIQFFLFINSKIFTYLGGGGILSEVADNFNTPLFRCGDRRLRLFIFE